MASDVDICNQALDMVGAETIAALGEASAGGRACQGLYPQARDALLALHPWRFAMTRQVLARLEESPPSDWSLIYALPSDCLAARYLEAPSRTTLGPSTRFEVRADRLLTDLADAVLIYSRRIEAAGHFDPLFVESLAALLAVRLGAALRVDGDLMREAQRGYQLALGQARAVDANQASNRDQWEAEWIEARS
ncbi:MAG: hypothetical protein RIC87_07960 [Kiloniellales bacterium]